MIPQSTRDTKPTLKELAPGYTRVYHHLRETDGDMNTVKKRGLMTANAQFAAKLIAQPVKNPSLISTQHDIIRFKIRLVPPARHEQELVGLDVHSQSTYTYNPYFELQNMHANHQRTKLLIPDYIAQEKKKTLWYETYNREVLIRRPHIPAEELIFPEQDLVRFPELKPSMAKVICYSLGTMIYQFYKKINDTVDEHLNEKHDNQYNLDFYIR